MNKKGQSIYSSFIFKLAESFGARFIALSINIFLARLLLPSDYGLIAIITVFVDISRVVIQSGVSTALIQKKNIGKVELSSAFYFSFTLATIIYFILYSFAPRIASYYNNSELINILRVLALTLFPSAFAVVQNAIVAREMRFKELMLSSLIATLISGLFGLAMAMAGNGYWALVAQQLSMHIILCLLLLYRIKWYPKFIFAFDALKSLLTFGWKLLASGVIDVIYENLRSLIIGKKYGDTDLGHYKNGRQFPELIMSTINSSIESVLLPVLSKEQDNIHGMKNYMRRSLVYSTYFVFPMMVGLAIVARPLIELLLTDKWIPCIVFLQLYCFDFALYPVHTTNLQAINAIGKPNIFLKLEIIKKSYGLIILLISVLYFKSVLAIVIGAVISSFISAFVNSYPNKKLLNYGTIEQLKDILPNVLLSITMGVIVYSLNLLKLPNLPLLLLQITTGSIVYIALSYLFKLESYIYIKALIKSFVRKE